MANKQRRLPFHKIRGYVTAVSLMRAVAVFLPNIEIPDYVKGKYSIRQHNKLVNALADLIEKIKANAQEEVDTPTSQRDYPVLHKDVTHIYEDSYNELDRILGFSGINKEEFMKLIKRTVNRIILCKGGLKYSVQLELF